MFLQEITFRLDRRPIILERFRLRSFDLEFWNKQECLFFLFVCLFFFCNGFLEKKLIFTETAFCGLLPLQGCTPQCYRVERLLVSVTRESEPTNSTDFDPIFTDLSPFLFRNIVGCSKFVEDSFEWPRMLLESSAAVFAFMENLLAENLVTNFPENVWLHRSAIDCLVQLNIFASWRSQNLIKSQVLRAADYLFQGSLDCLRGANNLRQKRKKMLKKQSLFHLFYPVLLQILLNSRKHDSFGEKNLKLLFNKRVKTDI